jgi:DAK2 domain fusion protein YloV
MFVRDPMPCSGQRLNASELRELLRAATLRLEQRAAAIDRLNVFPVPDADTGSNMAHGMRRGLQEAEQERSAAADAVAAAFARGALAGARGNSGLILSQFWRGLAEAARGSPTLGVEDLARGLAAGSDLAYRAVARPVPGTILTVMQDVARAAERPDGSLASFLRRLVEAARESVERTPRLLAVLRRSGVVDAGAEGLHRVLEGAWRFVQARAGEPPAEEPAEASRPAPRMQPQEAAYGFCTEFFLHTRAPDPDRVRAALQELGSSLIVTENEGAVRVHIHTGSPQAVLERAGELGRLEQVSTRDMDAQHREARLGSGGAGGQAVIARVPGAGLASVFRSLGAAEAAVRGDPAEEARLLAALQDAPAGDLLLIPNLPDAEEEGARLRERTTKRLHVVAARTVPQGVAAMVAFDPQAGLAENLRRMQEAIAAVRSLEVREEAGRVVGLLEGRPAADGAELGEVLSRVLSLALREEALGRGPAERLALFYGAGVRPEEARAICDGLRPRFPGLEMEALAGGQPGRGLLVSVE